MQATGPRQLALITGASAGIGAAFARAYAARGCDLVLVARRRERLEAMAADLCKDHGIRAQVVPADLSVDEIHLPILEAVRETGREVDILVNNAGFGVPRDFDAAPWSLQRSFLMTMAVSPCALAHGVIPGMLARGRGSIINVASIAGFSPGVAGNTLYPGVKSLIIKFSQALDAEYRRRGLRVTALCPGFTRTEFAAEAGIQSIMDKTPRLFAQTADQAASAGLRANDRGRVVAVSGWHNRAAVALMRGLPEPLVRAAIGAGAAKYRLEDPR